MSESVKIREGPAKQPKPGLPELLFTADKQRAEWFKERTSAGADADVDHLIEQRAASEAPEKFDWQFIGPSNIGGRATCLDAYLGRPGTIYLGTAGGGVWLSRDFGAFWKPLWRKQPVLSIGAIAVDRTNPDTIYVATGEANMTSDNYPGVGLFRSTDAGVAWELLAGSAGTGIPTRIGALAIDPLDNQHLVLGGVAYSDEKPAGLFSSFDGGKTWRREESFIRANYRCHSLAFHPAGDFLYAGIDAQGSRSGIWRWSRSDGIWRRHEEGFPPGNAIGRISLCICPSRPEILYAIVANRTSGVLGVFRTINGGDIWSAVGWDYFARETQMSYNNCIAVHPENPDFVICGGVDLHRTVNGGKTWTQATEWSALRDNGGYAHADHHAVFIMPGADGDLVYSANDGGVDYSRDGGITWQNRSDSLGATMFYAMDVAQSDSNVYGGGTQDNGSIATTTGQAGKFFSVLGGDGGWMVFDPNDATRLYASSQHMNIHRHRSSDGWVNVSPDVPSDEKSAVWMARIVMDPQFPTTVFTVSKRVWRTRNDADSWIPVSPVLDGSVITALEVAPAEPRVIFAGTRGGGFFRSMDGGNSWSQNLGDPLLTGKVIADIVGFPDDPEKVWVAVGGVNPKSPFAHVYRSRNAKNLEGALDWQPVDNNQLPNLPFHALVFQSSERPYDLFAACDAGVFRSADEGDSWSNVSGNLPHVMVTSLAYHRWERTLTAATYGRGLWRLIVG